MVKVNVEYMGMMNGLKVYRASSHTSPMAIAKKVGTGEYVLLVGDSFDQYTTEEHEVMFYHEIGHTIFGLSVEGAPRDVTLEHQCDLHAVEKTSLDRVMHNIDEIGESKDRSIRKNTSSFIELKLNYIGE